MHPSEEPFVSIVTPVYNGEKHIAECIESVLAQSYQNWEYTVVNNCSTDRTLEIVSSYADRDERIMVHNNEKHLGHLENGNHAFRLISPKSKYCKVIHADDWIFPECLTRMVELAEQHPNVGIVSSYRLDDTKVNLDGLPYPSHVSSGYEIGRKYLLDGSNFYFGSPSSLLIRSDLIRKRDRMYDPSNVHSDVSACLDLLRESDFGFVHQVLTFTRRHSGSITSEVLEKQFSYAIGKIKNLIQYGPHYLNEEELKEKLEKSLDSFHESLAVKTLFMGPRKTWKHGVRELKSIQIPEGNSYTVKLSYPKLIKHLIFEILDLRRNVRYMFKKRRYN
jgi:glycosyltransferase involved in cell wall biosynthesis